MFRLIAAGLVGALSAGLAAVLIAMAIAYTGTYNIAATEQRTSAVRWLFDTTFENSIKANAASIKAPSITPEMVAAGAETYKAMCQHCHAGPGVAWIPGCATGEEAYSIAILLLEEAARRDIRPEIQIFASDLDGRALATAREGRYPLSIDADVDEERLRRFFAREGETYRIKREVRDLVVFAAHSLLKDPPFSRLNFVSCRNLLIYLDRELQHRAISIFHYSLIPGGFLFLGSSETAENPPGMFVTVDRDARIFQATERARDRLPTLPRVLTNLRIPEIPTLPRPPRLAQFDSAQHHQALEAGAPPSILVNEDHSIVHLSETAGRFLLHSAGPVSNDAADVVRPELRLELRAALHRVFEQNERTVSLPIAVQLNGSSHSVVLFVQPAPRQEGARAALVMFVEGGTADRTSAEANAVADNNEPIARLREEVHATRTQLRTSREQYDSATEELRAANEELHSINEWQLDIPDIR